MTRALTATHVAALCSPVFVGVMETLRYRQPVYSDFRLGGSLYQAYVDACLEQTLILLSLRAFTKRFETLLEFK